MAKNVHDDVLDAALNIIKNNATRICVCSAEPTTYTEAITTYELADVTIDSADFTGPANDTSGRKLDVAAQNDVPVDNAGNATHVALVDVANTRLLCTTTCTTQALAGGGSVNIPTFKINLTDPT